jgi:hypothetical protein
MNNADFLEWLKDRLIYVYHEPENIDFVLRLKKIIEEERNKVPWGDR